MSFMALPAHDLLERFAAKDPAPGGGSASALAGALASTLARMVGGLTVDKKGYEAVAEEAATLAKSALALQARLEAAVTDDAKSFDAVMAAMALPKATDEEKAARTSAMQAGLKAATLAPLGVADACFEVGQLATRLLAIGNRNASTDAAVAVLLAHAGAEGALLNAAINLQSIKDAGWVRDHEARCEVLWRGLDGLRSALWPTLETAGLALPARQG